MGFEPTTSTLARSHSTAELFPQKDGIGSSTGPGRQAAGAPKSALKEWFRPAFYSYRRPSTGSMRAAHQEGAMVDSVQMRSAMAMVIRNTVGLSTTGR